MRYSPTEENYIKAIYHLQHLHGKVSTNLLSAEIKTKPASVTDMLKKLESKKLVHYQPYKGFTLSEPGNKVALEVIRKHRLWEFFLVEKLGFEWNKVHSVAEELEHITSRELIVKLDNFLGNPAFDPHGDPIPDVKGKMKIIRQVNLAGLALKKNASVSSVKNQSQQMLDMLNHYKISIGTRLRVNRHFDFDGSIEIKIDNQPATIVSKQVAQNVFCVI